MYNNVEFVIVSHFHVLKGPTLLHYYPSNFEKFENLFCLPELLIPDQIHSREKDITLFLLYKNKTDGKFQYLFDQEQCENHPFFLYTLSFNCLSSEFIRGSKVFSMSFITSLLFFQSFKPLLNYYLKRFLESNDVNLLKSMYDLINQKDFSIITDPMRLLMPKKNLISIVLNQSLKDKFNNDPSFRNKILEINDDTLKQNDFKFSNKSQFEICFTIDDEKILLELPLFVIQNQILEKECLDSFNLKIYLNQLLNAKLKSTFFVKDLTVYGSETPPLLILINAFFTKKKVLCYSYKNSSEFMVKFLIFLIQIISGFGILDGFLTNYNFFPIIDVSKISLLEKCQSFISGTINPFFKTNHKLWDVLYNLDTNEITISDSLNFMVEYDVEPINLLDAIFLSSLQSMSKSVNIDTCSFQCLIRNHIYQLIKILSNQDEYLITEESTFNFDDKNYSKKYVESVLKQYSTISSKFKKLLKVDFFKYCFSSYDMDFKNEVTYDSFFFLHNFFFSEKLNKYILWKKIINFIKTKNNLYYWISINFMISNHTFFNFVHSLCSNQKKIMNSGIEVLFFNLFNKNVDFKNCIINIFKIFFTNDLTHWSVKNLFRLNSFFDYVFDDLNIYSTNSL